MEHLGNMNLAETIKYIQQSVIEQRTDAALSDSPTVQEALLDSARYCENIANWLQELQQLRGEG